MAEEPKFWICKNCGKVDCTFYWEKCPPEPKNDVLCKEYANGNGFRPHNWIESDWQTFFDKVGEQKNITRREFESVLNLPKGRKLRRQDIIKQKEARFALEYGKRRSDIAEIYLKSDKEREH